MDIERLSTIAVENRISKVDRLKAYINSGEKEPSFDGYIGIFNNNDFSKKNFKKVNVQIKGKRTTKVPSKPTYPVSVVDLENYKNNDGVLFLVVYLDDEGDTLDIFYCSLLPYYIKQLLKNSDNKFTISVSLKNFPCKNNEILELMLNFHRDSQRQTSFANIEIPSIEELTKSGRLDRLTFSYSSLDDKFDNSLPYALEGKEVYLYAITKDSEIPIPVQHIDTIDTISSPETIKEPVSVNGVQYYDSYSIIHFKDYLVVKIGNSFTMKAYGFGEKNINIDFSIKVKGTLSTRIRDLEFLVEFIKAKGLEISNTSMPVDVDKSDNNSISLDNFEKQLDVYKKVKQALDILNVKKDLDYDNCTEEDFNRLDTLIEAFVEHKIRKVDVDPPTVAFYKISNISLLLFFIKHKDGIEMADFFNNKAMVIVKDANDNEYEVSQYYVLKKDTILACDNINYSVILPDFKSKEYSNVLFEEANLIMLEMLKVYDERPSEELLLVIKSFSDWLQQNTEYLTLEIARLNHFQILSRERILNISEKRELIEIYDNASNTSVKIGCSILLGNKEEATELLQTLSDEEQNAFKSYPIWKLMKN